MDEDGDTRDWFFDEIYMPDMIKHWFETSGYAEDIEMGRWYYDPNKQTVLLQLILPDNGEEEE